LNLQARSVFGGEFGTSRVIDGFRCEGTVLRERSDLGCVLLTLAADTLELAATASAACGLALPAGPGAIAKGSGAANSRRALWLTPRSWLIHCGLEDESDLIERVGAAFPDKLAHAVSFTDALCWLELAGSAASDLLTEGGFVSLERGGVPVGHAKRTLIAQVAVVLVHQGADSWLLGLERSRAPYFFVWLSSAANAQR
jgi:heterotetrameric sarcosine oxidase gamma subunit